MPLSRTAAVGLSLAILAALAVLAGEAFGLPLQSAALVGFAIGAAVGLINDHGPLARILGLGIGLVSAFIGYAVTAQFFPDTTSGRAVGMALTLALVTVLVVATTGRIPLWTALLGTAAFAGAFQASFAASPSSILTDGPVAFTTLLVTLSLGFAVSVLFSTNPAQQHTDDVVEPMGSPQALHDDTIPTRSNSDKELV